jgi:hypothetical protein
MEFERREFSLDAGGKARYPSSEILLVGATVTCQT